MPRLLMLVIVLLALGLAGCGDDDDDSSGTEESPAASSSEGGTGLLFTQTTGSGSLEADGGETFTLTLAEPAAHVTAFTDRPQRSASSETVAEFVSRWEERGFGDVPPNAALVLDDEPEDGDTVVVEISDPVLDEASGALTYTATPLDEGTAALPEGDAEADAGSFEDAHLFIDPSATASRGIYIKVQQAEGVRTRVSFDSPWTVIIGTGEEGIGVVSPSPGGGSLIPGNVGITSNGAMEFAVSGGSGGAITGTAQVPSGAKATIQVDDGPTEPLPNGKFSVGAPAP